MIQKSLNADTYIEEFLSSPTEILLFKYIESLQPCTIRSLIEYASKYYEYDDRFLNFDKVVAKLVNKKVLRKINGKCQMNPNYKGSVYEVNPIYRSKVHLNIIYVKSNVRPFLNSSLASFEDAINSFNIINDDRSFHKFIIHINNSWLLLLFAIAIDSDGENAIFENKSKPNNSKTMLAEQFNIKGRNATKSIHKLKQNYLLNNSLINKAEGNNIDLINLLRDEIEHYNIVDSQIKHLYWMQWQTNVEIYLKVLNSKFPKYINTQNYSLALDITKTNFTKVISSKNDFMSKVEDIIVNLDSRLSAEQLKDSPSRKTVLIQTVDVENKENLEALFDKCISNPHEAYDLLKGLKGQCFLSSKDFSNKINELIKNKNEHLSHHIAHKYANIFGITKESPFLNKEFCIYDVANNPPCYKYSERFVNKLADLINAKKITKKIVNQLIKENLTWQD